MRLKRIVAALLGALLLLSAAACNDAKEPAQSPSPGQGSGGVVTLEDLYTQKAPDTVMLTVEGQEVRWDELFYFVQYSVYQLLGGTDILMSWTEPYGEDKTVRQVVLENAVQLLLQNEAVLYGAKLMNVTLSEEDEREVQAQWDQYVDTYGEEELLNMLREQYCTKEQYFEILRISALLKKCLAETFGEHGEKLSEADLAEYVRNEDYMMAKHILIKTTKTDGETGKDVPMTEEEKAQAREKAERLLAELDSAPKEELDETFDRLVSAYSEDPGSTSYPEGYLFTKGNMVPEFENATRALEVGQYSGLVETTYGYHIIYRVPVDYDAVPISYSAYGGEYSLRTLTAYSMFQALMDGWQEQLQVTYSDDLYSLDFESAGYQRIG